MKTNSNANSRSPNGAIKDLFQRKPLLERLMPVMGELLSTITCERKETERTLPDYCYNIFQTLRKGQFRVLPEAARLESAGEMNTDCEALGRVIGAGLRCFRFGELEVDAVLKRESLSEWQTLELRKAFSVMPGLCELLPGPDAANQGGGKGAEKLWSAFLTAFKSAHQCGPQRLAQLTGAFQKGVEGFLDDEGRCRVEHARDNIYWFLLIVWPEIREMQQARPPLTRKDFAVWLEPFARAGFVSIGDFDQLLDVCDDIGLKFKGRGAPRKK